MTFEEFQTLIRKKTGFDKYWYYLLCIAVIILSLVYLYFLITHPERFKGSVIFFYAGFAFLFFLGSYGLYLLPNRYKVITIDSDLPIEKKQLLTKRLIEDLAYINLSQPGQYLFFNLKAKWWQSTYNVHFFYDDHKFAFSIQGHDFDGGFIDFGGTERKRKLIAKKIKDLS